MYRLAGSERAAPRRPGRHCSHCIDENGQLQSFDQHFERMTAWQAR
jgi:hypothetical protein